MTTPVASFKKSESLAKPRAATFPAFQQAITIKRMRERWGGEEDETRPVSRRQKWLQFGTGRFHAQWAIVIEAAVKRSLASTTRGWNQFLSLPSWYEAAGDGGRGDSSRGSLKDAFYGGTRRARNRKCVLHLSSPGGRFIVHHRLERWMDACIHEPSASLRAFHWGGDVSFRYRGRGIFTRPVPSLEQPFPVGMRATFCAIYYRPTCGFFLYYTAPIPGIRTIPATPGKRGWMLLGRSVVRRSF